MNPLELDYPHLVRNHPCLSPGPGTQSARLHLPVAPACNLSCRFCRRAFNGGEERPGVARGLLPVAAVPGVLARAQALCPDLAVVGVAGPGDALATRHAVEALGLVHRLRPDLIKCLSTNGLRLEAALPGLLAAGVSTLTVTVNGVRPEVLARLIPWVERPEGRLSGEAGARDLVARQMAGIRAAARAGLLVKVNMVLVPDVNAGEVDATAAAVRGAGAALFNLIPLLPGGSLAGCRAPDCAELDTARAAAGRHLPVFRHCRHCRADAVGVPGGEDFAPAVYGALGRPRETFSHG